MHAWIFRKVLHVPPLAAGDGGRRVRALLMASLSPSPLSPAEVAHFKEFGFVIKRGYLDQARCAAAREWVWSNSVSAKHSIGQSGKLMDRDDPTTWCVRPGCAHACAADIYHRRHQLHAFRLLWWAVRWKHGGRLSSSVSNV